MNPPIDNRLKAQRTAKGLSPSELAKRAGITRQAVYAIEANDYLPTTAVALRLALALGCRVEDLFSLSAGGDEIDGEFVGMAPARPGMRVKLATIGDRMIVRPVADLGDVLNFTVPADGVLTSAPAPSKGRAMRVRVRLSHERPAAHETVAVAGCDPAIVLAGEYLRRRRAHAEVQGWTMGSEAALDALKRREVHIAGLHLLDPRSGEPNLPYLRRHLRGLDVLVVTFASWEQGLLVAKGNPKGIRGIDDLARENVMIVNREPGAGARWLLDAKLKAAHLPAARVRGYGHTVSSHLAVARAIAEGRADAGIGLRSAALLRGLEFLPLQEERYDLVVPKAYVSTHTGIASLLETIVSLPFRTEIQALGGYDTRETGKVREL